MITATHKNQWPLPLSLPGVTVRLEADETSVLEKRHDRRLKTLTGPVGRCYRLIHERKLRHQKMPNFGEILAIERHV